MTPREEVALDGRRYVVIKRGVTADGVPGQVLLAAVRGGALRIATADELEPQSLDEGANLDEGARVAKPLSLDDQSRKAPDRWRRVTIAGRVVLAALVAALVVMVITFSCALERIAGH